MAPKNQRGIATLYANLMGEVKARIDYIDKAVHGRTHMPGPIVREFCYLQLRLLCELIALSCLVAHGDISSSYAKRLGKQWSADKIIDQLSQLQPHFYPQPIRQANRMQIEGVSGWNLEVIHPSPLPKADLLGLYAKCHQHLHRGNVKKLLSEDTPIELHTNFPEIINLAQKINDLLSHHIVVLNPNKGLFCLLRNADDNNRVQAGFFEAKLS